MKQSFIFLLILTFALSAWHFYNGFNKNASTEKHENGVLSDIADEVIAIPLQTPEGMEPIRHVRNINKQGNDLFLISRNTLFHFNRKGDFIRQITDPEEISVAGYMINSGKKELIVLGNKDDIHYYDFDGKLLKKKKLRSELTQKNVMSAVSYNDRIYTTERKFVSDSVKDKESIVDCVVEYDSSFNKIGEKKINNVNIGRKRISPNNHKPQLLINKNSGNMYAYQATDEPENLLKDTLFIFNNNKHLQSGESIITTYPVQLGTRFWLSSYTNNASPEMNYTFCLDLKRNEAWQIKGGFTDDFYSSGNISNLSPSDIHSCTYSFFKNGDALKESFPENAENDNAVVFIVKLKV